MNDGMILAFVASILIVGSAALSWFSMNWIGNRWPRAIKITVSGFVPILLVTLVMAIWHNIEAAEYRVSGSQEPFMGPLVIMVYTFPFFFFMIVVDLVAAALSKKRP